MHRSSIFMLDISIKVNELHIIFSIVVILTPPETHDQIEVATMATTTEGVVIAVLVGAEEIDIIAYVTPSSPIRVGSRSSFPRGRKPERTGFCRP